MPSPDSAWEVRGRSGRGDAAPLWSYRELAAALGVPDADGPDVAGIEIDSRRVRPGDLFVALPGDPGPRFATAARSARDGHDFIGDAAARGAVAVLARRAGAAGAVPRLVVGDTIDGLWALGRAARQRLAGPVAAVTGSSGKTTFKSFAAAALGTFATEGSLNNHLGVPLSLARTPARADGAVIEIGTNHPGEIAPLAELARPDVAVVLNVQPAHIGNFAGLDAIRREKLSIARGLGADGALVRPRELAAEFAGRTVTFGTRDDADARLLGVDGDRARIAAAGRQVVCPVPGGGAHRALSACAAAALLLALELPLGRLERLEGVAVPRGRGNRIAAAGVTVVDESYNANPASMAATLAAFAQTPGRRIAILGDMAELGAEGGGYHRALAPRCAPLDGVLCVGAHMAELHALLPRELRLGCAERADAALAARCAELLEPGDSVLVKGSNGVFWSGGFVDALRAALERRAANAECRMMAARPPSAPPNPK